MEKTMGLNKLIAGNWKMNGDINLIDTFVRNFSAIKLETSTEILICPSFPYIGRAFEAFHKLGIKVGAQDCHHKREGSHTGDVSAQMLMELGASYVIIGHSERRDSYISEDVNLREKFIRVTEKNLTPIICVGENLEERQTNKTEIILEDQLKSFLTKSIADSDFVVAYEPKWAIGTGKVASIEQINETHNFIREILCQSFNMEIARAKRIIYGGSVKPDNSKEILNLEEVDGALIGGASLNPKDFLTIIKDAS